MKTTDLEWYDLFRTRPTRRDFLRVGGSVAGLVALGALPGCSGRRHRFSAAPFPLGVASGDPTPDGVVLWTRLGRDALEGAGAFADEVTAEWEISDDEAFSRVVRSGTVRALPELGHSAHAEVTGLEPSRGYFYRWIAGGQVSPVGRTRTAPSATASPDGLRFAFVSCQNYEHGYYTAFRHLAEEDVDLVVHLGDYIYERRFGQNPVRDLGTVDVATLEQYRERYTTYKTDAELRAAHAATPWIVTWDDHEVANNYANDVSEDDRPRDEFLLRRAAAYQAYYEFMPLRRSSMPSGPDMPLYRRLRFGDLMEMSVLDTRQYRSDQPCGDGTKPTCAAHMAPSQTIMGADQRDWLFRGLTAADARWNVLAQQVMVARLRGVSAEGEETWSMDKWDGYPRERQALLDHLATSGVPNPVVLTGDIHSNWVADLWRDFDDVRSGVVGTELVGTSITSGGDGQDTSRGGERTLANNPHVKFYNGQRGYVTVALTPERLTADYRVVPLVSEPGGPVHTRASFVVEDGKPGAEEA